MKSRFVTAYHAASDTYHVGVVTEDGRCRVDFHGDLSELTFWDTDWTEPSNPWKGGLISGPEAQRFDLVAAYS